MDDDGLREGIVRYLEGHHVLTLATEDDGGPWATPLFYASDDLDVYFLSDPETRHCQAIVKRPRVSAAIYGEHTDWTEITGVQLDGWADMVGEALASRAWECYAGKFPFVRALVPSEAPYRLYRVRPRWVRLIDNTRGLGFKEELSLEPG